MNTFLGLTLAVVLACRLQAAPDDFPLVPDDIRVTLFARDPLVRNPCAITFDAQGRLCVGMGPQYRRPSVHTPGDSVWILIDDDKDGVAERRVEFAKGFNAIQGLAWNGQDLWVGNAPDLTVVRDLDGDDEADEYVRVYTDLGNLEHGVHGMNFGPDGKLYLSKGNSKGLTELPDRVAPKPFRELWGVVAPPGTPDLPEPVLFTKETYQKNFHHPSDDWGLSGGILRCDPDGKNLEIVARGFRNPWDICFDDEFNWLGTDNDQTIGDKIFAPFYGAHFGWGHPWSFDWKGDDHLPSAPSSGPLFEGSGTGIIFSGLESYPEAYRGVFLINDWIRREIYIYRPKWDGAWLKSAGDSFERFAHADGGRSMGQSEGRSFDPVDIEIGPDGAIYVSSWGRQYGLEEKDGQQINEGRIYRLMPKATPALSWSQDRDPWVDLGSHVPIWRTNARNALVAQGASTLPRLRQLIAAEHASVRLKTWALWTLAAIAPMDSFIEKQLDGASLNLKIQALRILGQQGRLPDGVSACLTDAEPRVRHAAVLALREARESRWNGLLLDLLAVESDRIVFYSAWGALGDLMSVAERKALLAHSEPGLRRAGLLSLLEEDALAEDEIEKATRDEDRVVAQLASRRLGGKAETVVKGPSLFIEDNVSLLTPPRTASSVESALAAMSDASADRGRLLFLSKGGANCTICHQMEGYGNIHAPDLGDIGTRADARTIISSILEPSADITEGFALQSVTTKSGAGYAGILLDETGLTLRLAQVNGDVITVETKDVVQRRSVDLSAMPAIYKAMLTPQQVADLAAYLLDSSRGAKAPNWDLEKTEDRLSIRLDGRRVVDYFFRHPETKRPFFAHVKTPGGIQVTRNFPPIEGIDPTDHGYLHPGLSLGFAVLDGENFWHNDRGEVLHKRFTAQPKIVAGVVTFAVENHYRDRSGRLVCREAARYRISRNPEGYLISSDHSFSSDESFYFGVKEEMGLSMRVATPIRVKQAGGSIRASHGGVNEKGTWGKVAKWWDYSGTIDERHVGIQIISGKDNPATWSHSRDYGVLVANPFPVDIKANRDKRVTIEANESFRLSFGIQIHEGTSPETYHPEVVAQRFFEGQ